MSITSAGTPTNVHSTSATVTGSFGSLTIAAGNLLVAVVSVANTTAETQAPTITSGWTLRASETNRGAAGTSNVSVYFYTKTAVGSDSAPTFTGTAGGTAASDMYCFVLQGASVTQPIDVIASYASGTTAGTVSAQTATTSGKPANANGYLISVFAQERAAASLTWTTAGTSGDGTTAVTKLLNGNGVSSVLQTYVGALHNPAVHTVQDGGHFSTDTTAFGAGLVVTFKDAEYIPARFIQSVVTADDAFSANPTMVYTVASGVFTSPGNVVVLAVRNGSGDAITAVTDSRGNTWQVDETGSGSNADANIMSAVMGAATYLRASDTITVTNAGTGGNTGNTGYAFEVGGLDTTTTSGKTTVLDHGHAATTAAGDTATTAGVAGQGGDFAVSLNAASVALTHTLTTADADSGGTWTEQFGNATSFVDTAWQLSTFPNQYSVTWTIAASHNHDSSIVLYAAAQHSGAVPGAVANVAVAGLAGSVATGAAVAGALATSTVAGLAGTAVGGTGATVSGAKAAITVAGLAGTPSGGTGATVSGAVAAVTVAGLAGTAVGSSGAAVSGAVAASTVAGLAGSVEAGQAVSGAVAAVVVAGLAGTVEAGIAVSGAIAATTVAGLAGTATGGTGATVSGAVAASTVAGLAGSPKSGQAVSGALATITVAGLAGTATGGTGATVSGALAAVTVAGLAGTLASGVAVPGAVAAIAVAGLAGSVSAGGAAAVSGAVASITVAGLAGSVEAGQVVSGAVAASTVAGLAGTVEGGVAIPGAVAAVVVAGLAGTASAGGAAAVSGAVASVTVDALAGTASASTPLTGATATITVAGLAGTPSGGAIASGAVATITVDGLPGDVSAGGAASVDGAVATMTVAGLPGTASAGSSTAGATASIGVSALAGILSAAAEVPGATAFIAVAALAGLVNTGLIPPDERFTGGYTIHFVIGGTVSRPRIGGFVQRSNSGGSVSHPLHGGDETTYMIGGKRGTPA